MLDFHTLDVFTERRFGGNPLAVVLGADGLATARMQLIAREFNLSETVFVQRPDSAGTDFRLRIFTPTHEMPFAGHPTVGTACLLAELGLVRRRGDVADTLEFVLGENVGPVPVRVRHEPGRAPYGELTTAVLPEAGPPAPPAEALAAMLGLAPRDIGSHGELPRTASCGVPYLLVPLRQPELLASISVDLALWRGALDGAWARQLYVYARGYEGELRARMFAPGLGVHEDPATGSAAVALAGALALESPVVDGELAWTIEQGHEMGRPSRLFASATRHGGKVTAVRVGGHAVRVTGGTLEL